jgi:hypothetical protein
VEPKYYTGFNPDALTIEDGTEIIGFFQTERYWNRDIVKNWYRFRENRTRRVREKYKEIDFAKSVALHLRFGDFVSSITNRIVFYTPPQNYYIRAFSHVRHSENILVFSDAIEVAKRHLQSWKSTFMFIEDNEAYEDLYLMTQCHDIIISASTLSWWGALLNEYPDRIVVAPAEGPFRPGPFRPLFGVRNNDYLCHDWVAVRALRPYIDNRFIVLIKESFKHPCKVLFTIIQTIIKIVLRKNHRNK